MATALFGHFGIEWDIASASAAEQAALAEAIAFYKRMRPLLHSGQVVRADHPNPAAYLHGVVAADRAEALFAYVQLTARPTRRRAWPAARLDPDRAYRVEPVPVAGERDRWRRPRRGWRRAGSPSAAGPGRGRPASAVLRQQALLLHVTGA